MEKGGEEQLWKSLGVGPDLGLALVFNGLVYFAIGGMMEQLSLGRLLWVRSCGSCTQPFEQSAWPVFK